MQQWIIQVLNDFGYIGILLLIAIENIFPPIPSEVILTFSGFMTKQTSMNIWLVCLWSTVGSVLGSVVLYYLGRLVTPKRLGKIIDKWGKFLRVKKEDITRAETWFTSHGKSTVFFCRFIPIVRSLISIPAGMSNMNIWKFLFYTTLGTSIWNIVLVNLGAWAGSKWALISEYMNTYSKVVLIVIVVIIIILAVWYVLKRKKRQSYKQEKADE